MTVGVKSAVLAQTQAGC